MTRLERAFDVISSDEPDEDLALLAARLALGYWFSGDLERAAERAELALDIAEAHALPEALAIALRAKAAVVGSRGHCEEARALARSTRSQIALEHDLVDDAERLLLHPLRHVLPARRVRRRARLPRRGSRARPEASETGRASGPCWPSGPTRSCMLGRWDEALAVERRVHAGADRRRRASC